MNKLTVRAYFRLLYEKFITKRNCVLNNVVDRLVNIQPLSTEGKLYRYGESEFVARVGLCFVVLSFYINFFL